jgi:hypothetical protein
MSRDGVRKRGKNGLSQARPPWQFSRAGSFSRMAVFQGWQFSSDGDFQEIPDGRKFA